MRAKLLGAVSAAALLGSVTVANAQGPMQLTDTQLDGVTAGFAAVDAFAIGASATGFFFLFQNSVHATASITAAFAPVGTGLHLVGLSAFATVP